MAALKKIIGSVAALAVMSGGAIALTGLNAPTAVAQTAADKATVDAAIARGEIGEQIDGYLGVVSGKSPSSDVRTAMSAINIARKAVYTDAAAANGVTPAVFAQLTGEKQIKKSAPGTWVKDASGQWKQK